MQTTTNPKTHTTHKHANTCKQACECEGRSTRKAQWHPQNKCPVAASVYAKIFCGGHSHGETPSTIPNLEAKPMNADGTAPHRVWESRKPPQPKPHKWGEEPHNGSSPQKTTPQTNTQRTSTHWPRVSKPQKRFRLRQPIRRSAPAQKPQQNARHPKVQPEPLQVPTPRGRRPGSRRLQFHRL